MLRNHIVIALRLLVKNKVFSIINILGLSAGIACCILIALYVQDELSYEKGFSAREKIFRINTTFVNEGSASTSAYTSPPIAPDLARILPEISKSTRVVRPLNTEQNIVRYHERTFFERKAFLVDSPFLDVFPYRLDEGDAATALDLPSSVLISKDVAERIFGKSSPLDELLIINSGQSVDTFRVTGVVARPDFPSHLDADLYMSMNSAGTGRWVLGETTWSNNNMIGSYLKFHDSPAIPEVEAKIARELEARAGAELRQSGRQKILRLQNLDDIRLYSPVRRSADADAAGSIVYIYILSSIGGFILLLACINFMNLTTARSSGRASEVGIRKSMGACRGDLIRQFLGESMVIVTFAMIVSFGLVIMAMPAFNSIMQKQLSLNENNLPFLCAAVLIICLLTGLIAGSYPSFFLSSLKPVQVLKGISLAGGGSQVLRKGLVVFQFVITITLISSIMIIQGQMDFIRSRSLGFDSGQVLIVPLRTQQASAQYAALKSAFERIGGVNAVSAASSLPSTPLSRDWLLYKAGGKSDETVQHDVISVDAGYFKTLGIEMIAGRDFIADQDNLPADTAAPLRIVVNESSLRTLQISHEEAVGTTLVFEFGPDRYEFAIIGVVNDFHQFSMHRRIGPMLFIMPRARNMYPYLAVSADMRSSQRISAEMKAAWDQLIEDAPFERIFLDENLETLYAAEKRTSNMLTISTSIALIISCLGLYGLSVFIAERKTKEIGIRKVAGASVENIIGMLSKEYVRLIVISFLISVPLGHFVMERWLQGFAYRIEPGIAIFLLSGTISFLIAWLTISLESFRAALRNPAETLRAR